MQSKTENNIVITDELFSLDSEEITLAKSKNGEENKLAFTVCLKFFQIEGKYPTNSDIIDQFMISALAMQLNCYTTVSNIRNYNWESRTAERFRQEIKLLLGYKTPTTSINVATNH